MAPVYKYLNWFGTKWNLEFFVVTNCLRVRYRSLPPPTTRYVCVRALACVCARGKFLLSRPSIFKYYQFSADNESVNVEFWIALAWRNYIYEYRLLAVSAIARFNDSEVE
eukprot:6195112-Pleurochrysis_carterae.AAC.2